MPQKLRRCPHCESNVTPIKKDDPVPLIIAMGLLYYPFYFMKRPSQCPICGNTDLESYDTNAKTADVDQQEV